MRLFLQQLQRGPVVECRAFASVFTSITAHQIANTRKFKYTVDNTNLYFGYESWSLVCNIIAVIVIIIALAGVDYGTSRILGLYVCYTYIYKEPPKV